MGILSRAGTTDLSRELNHHGKMGNVSHYEFQRSIRRVYDMHHPSTGKMHLDKQTIDSLWSLLDWDKTGKICIEELVDWMLETLTPTQPKTHSPKEINNDPQQQQQQQQQQHPHQKGRRVIWKREFASPNKNDAATMMSKIQQRVLSKHRCQSPETEKGEDLLANHEQVYLHRTLPRKHIPVYSSPPK